MVLSPEETISRALEKARSGRDDELPIAAVVVDGDGSVISSAKNSVIELKRSTAHAELLAIESVELGRLKRDGEKLTIGVTLEPCPMCAWAIRISGIGRVIFGAFNPEYGAAGSSYDLLRDRRFGRVVEVIGGVSEIECQELLQNFFESFRDN